MAQAAEAGQAEVVQALLNAGASFVAEKANGDTPMHVAHKRCGLMTIRIVCAIVPIFCAKMGTAAVEAVQQPRHSSVGAGMYVVVRHLLRAAGHPARARPV